MSILSAYWSIKLFRVSFRYGNDKDSQFEKGEEKYSIFSWKLEVGGIRRWWILSRLIQQNSERWRRFFSFPWNMDVFCLNGNSLNMASRPLTAPSKPAVFQNPRKKTVKPLDVKKRVKKVVNKSKIQENKVLQKHSVEMSEFFYPSDFTWNQFLDF